LQNVYGLYEKKSNISNVHLPEDQHDYGFTKRVPMYQFFATVFGLNLKAILNKKGDIDESFITIEPAAIQQVFNTQNSMPPYALSSHEAIVKAFHDAQGEN
jgi:hypothetical protein